MKSTDVLSPGQRRLWDVLRVFVPPQQRRYYEGHPAMRGQLWYAERKLLYKTVRRFRPRICFEIGTWKGGGSTLFITRALLDNRAGKLHTIEIDEECWNEARRNYETFLPELRAHVDFHFGDYREKYSEILAGTGSVDFLLLDGAEDAGETVRQYEFFLPYLETGSVVMAHDWFTEKARLLRPLLEQKDVWEILTVLGPPRSVGFAVARKR